MQSKTMFINLFNFVRRKSISQEFELFNKDKKKKS